MAGFELGGCPDVDEGGCLPSVGREVQLDGGDGGGAPGGVVLLVQPVRAVRAVVVVM